MDSLNGCNTLVLGLINEYNTQVRASTWGMDIGLSNHV
jgi:hypothetical protein